MWERAEGKGVGLDFWGFVGRRTGVGGGGGGGDDERGRRRGTADVVITVQRRTLKLPDAAGRVRGVETSN